MSLAAVEVKPLPVLKPASAPKAIAPKVNDPIKATIERATIEAELQAALKAERAQSPLVASAPAAKVATPVVTPAAYTVSPSAFAQPAVQRASQPVDSPFKVASAETAARASSAPFVKVSVSSVAKKSEAPKGTLEFQMASLNAENTVIRPVTQQPLTYAPTKEWGIQVGAFKDKQTAKQALSRAFSLVSSDAEGAKVDIASEGGEAQSAIHRARLANLSRKQAHEICQKLQSMQQACFPLRVN
jgi:hypothetical protein